MEKTKAEVLRYLGRRNQEVPEDLDRLVDECLELTRTAAIPRHVSRIFDISSGSGGLFLAGADVALRGEDIARHLSGCGQAVLMAATLGAGADALIRKWERADLTRSLIIDACATQLIEEYCGEAERKIRAEAASSGLASTWRFSPGYGDLPLDIQPRILDALNAGRTIGLTCSESLILLPRKSVTALIGLGKGLADARGGCGACTLRDKCGFRKDGFTDECSGISKG